MIESYSFGEWLKQRRAALRLTQREVGVLAYCSAAMIKKIEADERRPSAELAQALADALQVPADHQELFIACARGHRPVDALIAIPPAGATSPPPGYTPPSPIAPLPTPATPFLGRSAEVADITAKLTQNDCRLLTLLGPGGIGKTRLAIAVAAEMQNDFHDGVVFVPLAATGNPAHLPQAIAQVLHTPLIGSDPAGTQLQRLLRRRRMLLVLDNFEQLTSAAGLLSELLSAAPGLNILVTSRERLNLAEEWLYPVPALDEAARLFRQTAGRVKPDFNATVEAPAVNQICRLVAGHPLAVELAAGWTRFMSCAQIAAQIQQDLDFLAGSTRNTPDRHRSLRALFDHSWNMLTAAEQAALARLSVFRGGFAPEQAAMVAGASWLVLMGLVDKSLVAGSGNNRFDLHELIHQYAAEKLAASGEEKEVRQAHFSAYLQLARQLQTEYFGPLAIASYQNTELEYDNIRAALNWGKDNLPGEAILELTQTMFKFWLRGGYWSDGEYWLKTGLSLMVEQDSATYCLALSGLGTFTALQGRFSDALPLSQQSYAMARRLARPTPLVITLLAQGQARRETKEALAAFDEMIAICREQAGEPYFREYLAEALHLKGVRLMDSGRLQEAENHIAESLAIYRAVGDVHRIAYPLGNMGRIALVDGRLREANELISESVAIARTANNRVSMGDWLFRLGQVQFYLGNLDAAEACFQETLQLYEEVGNRRMGPPGVLSNMALIALVRKDVETAGQRISASFQRFQYLYLMLQRVDTNTDLLHFGDPYESVAIAGLVAHAQEEWLKAILVFRYLARTSSEYTLIRPLQGIVAVAEVESRDFLSATEVAFAEAIGQHLTMKDILDLILEEGGHNWELFPGD